MKETPWTRDDGDGDEFKRKGSEEASDIIRAGITKDDILEMEVSRGRLPMYDSKYIFKTLFFFEKLFLILGFYL